MALTEDTKRQVNEAIMKGEKAIKEVEKDINEARRAGIDVTEQASEVKKQKDRLRMMKGVYGMKIKGV